jgi:L-serine dehydratase
MGPQKAAQIFLKRYPEAVRFGVTLYGSLAATGKGHMTDKVIEEVLNPVAPVNISWLPQKFLPFHPNGMEFIAYDSEGQVLNDWTVYSIGGGALSEGKGEKDPFKTPEIYSMNSLTEITRWCDHNGRSYWEYVQQCEKEGIWEYLRKVWQVMQDSVERGLNHEGVLPGPLNLPRKAANYYIKASGYKPSLQSRGMVFAYALAVSEENASGGTIVTAPTCGACGVLPAVLYHCYKSHAFSEIRILHALATAGIIGNIVKKNASISGAEVGCQGEVGVACAMASAAGCQLFGGSPDQIEYAAEMGLEHHLGMTCDPVCGLVQIPCIERNAFAAARALDSQLYASFSDGKHCVSFDHVVHVMKLTGHDLPSLYKETSEGGLAKEYLKDNSI